MIPEPHCAYKKKKQKTKYKKTVAYNSLVNLDTGFRNPMTTELILHLGDFKGPFSVTTIGYSSHLDIPHKQECDHTVMDLIRFTPKPALFS